MILGEVVNLTSTDWIIISSLAGVILAMAAFIRSIFKIQEKERKEQSEILHGLHETHRVEQKENLISMIQAMTKNATVIEGNTKVIDEVKTLMHTVNDRLIKMDAKNGNGH